MIAEETKIAEVEDQADAHTVILPASLVANQHDHSQRDKFVAKCFNNFYDILTIFISVADVTTDLMVLVSFYNSNQMTFFWISFTILIIAQIGYLMVFIFSFEIEDFIENAVNVCCSCECTLCCKCCDYFLKCLDRCKCQCECNSKACKICNKIFEAIAIILTLIILAAAAISLFVLLLPFGHLVSFLMYFAENEESAFAQCITDKVGIKKRTNIPLEEHWSEMAKFTAKKINKHGGFILEAFLEALPQSILQLIAMVYLKQTNLISVGSIILSMTSIMTKSLVISQGIEWKSFLFTWLAVCTDFFSIFFVVSWIFLSNEYVNGTFLGHFSIIGQVWCWKVGLAIIAPILFVAVAYVAVAMWFIIYGIIKENSDEPWWYQILMLLLFLTLGNAALVFVYCVLSFIIFLVAEILCFTIVAVFVWLFLTVDRWDYTEQKVADIIKKLLYFIGGASYRNNDRIVRILCVNYAYNSEDRLGKYILARKEKETLHQVKYTDIRNNCHKPKRANLFKTGIKTYCSGFDEFKKECIDQFDWTRKFQSICTVLWCAALLLILYISLPVYILSRIASVLYPYFIIGYLYYYDLWFKMHVFELSMLAFYVLLHLLLLVLGVFVCRTHRWLWHVAPGVSQVNKWNDDVIPFLKECYSFYDSIQWYPVTKEIVLQRFGADIGPIILSYLKT